jgi:macrocin-O-methyltransferase TylF-like protien
MTRLLKDLLKKGFATVGIRVSRIHPESVQEPFAEAPPVQARYDQDGLITIHNDHFRRTPSFRAAYQRGVLASNGVDSAFEWRVHVALWAARTSLRVPGDFIECGVNSGFISSAIMQHLQWNSVERRFYLVDTFKGPPLDQYDPVEIERGRRRVAEDAIAAGAYVTDLARIHQNFAEWPNAIIIQGVVPDVLPTISTSQVAFLHIDMNCAHPEQATLQYFWDRLSPGAIVLLDDYAYFGYEQQTSAIDAVAEAIGANILSMPTGQGIIMK